SLLINENGMWQNNYTLSKVILGVFTLKNGEKNMYPSLYQILMFSDPSLVGHNLILWNLTSSGHWLMGLIITGVSILNDLVFYHTPMLTRLQLLLLYEHVDWSE
ncbi:hypothetical protein ACJX0J_034158, partial [Zea mays]